MSRSRKRRGGPAPLPRVEADRDAPLVLGLIDAPEAASPLRNCWSWFSDASDIALTPGVVTESPAAGGWACYYP